MSNQPTVKPFTYVYIPADEKNPVCTRNFKGKSEQDLRSELARHFRSLLLSDDQKSSMSRHIAAESEKNAAAHEQRRSIAEKNNEEPDTVQPIASAGTDGDKSENKSHEAAEEKTNEEAKKDVPPAAPVVSSEVLINQFLENNAFEVVPVTMPTRETHFIGKSLYVDDCGQFKSLPVNCRASKLSKREIRGDAFLLSNHDDPALEDWERVDTTLECYEELYHNSNNREVYDTSNSSQMKAITKCREDLSKRIEEEDVVKATNIKLEGNNLVGKGEWKGAAVSYGECIELMSGRRDLLQDEAAATSLYITARLNRSLCFAKQRQFDAAAEDARWALSVDEKNVKALYRLIQAEIGLQEYEKATQLVEQFIQEGGPEDDKRALQQAIAQGSQALRERQKKMFGKMFSSS